MPRWAESGIGRLMLRRTCMGSSPKLGGSWSGCGTRTSDCGVAWVCHRPMRWPSPSWTRRHRPCARSPSRRRCQRWMRGRRLRRRWRWCGGCFAAGPGAPQAAAGPVARAADRHPRPRSQAAWSARRGPQPARRCRRPGHDPKPRPPCPRRAPVRHVLGLTATPYRRDGLQDIITMQCGPIRHRIASRDRDAELGARRLALELRVRPTKFHIAADPDGAEGPPIQAVFRALVDDEQRTALVCDDVLAALAQGRRCLVLSQWKQHVHRLAQRLQDAGAQPIVLEGGLAKKARDRLLAAVQATPPDQDLVVVATGQYLGEGFDCPQLDTLFLAFPMAFKGKLVQYTGRLLRPHPGKRRVTVYDYADSAVAVLHSMHTKRLTTYRTLGFAELPTDPLT